MKKRTVFILMAVTVMMSGVAGYGGASLAGYVQALNAPAVVTVATAGGESAPNIAATANVVASSNMASASAAAERPASSAIEMTPLTAYQSLSTAWESADRIAANTATTNGRTALTVPGIAKAVANTVVEIETEQMVTDRWFGQRVLSGAGSGVIVSADGYIITCNHVIADANKITVRLKNGEIYTAALVGRDVKTDLAVLKITASNLETARYGNSAELVVGELAVAVGNPLGELGGTVTEGIISALNRDINIDGEMMNLLQTSAAVNPGNSGGGLFNTYGELIGVVNAKSGGSNIEGIGFAVPAQTVKTVADQLIQYGYVLGRVDFGITLVDISDMFTAMRYGVSSLGVYVGKSDADSGLQAGDRIVSINGVAVMTAADIKNIYESLKVGDKLNLVIARSGKSYNATVTLKQAQY